MRKAVTILTALCLLLSVLVLPAGATETGYSWFCKHVSDHKQPPIDPTLAFCEELDAFYVDRRHGDEDEDRVVYLTFDAGFENGNVEQILNILQKEQVPGGFFILERMITHHEELVRRMKEEGHTVCNHTMHHKNMSRLDEEAFLKELRDLETLYRERIGGEMAPFYRPPEGRFSKRNLEVASQNGYKTIFWSFAYADWDNNKQMSPERAKEMILSNVHNGAVLLLHPTSNTNAAVLEDVIVTLKAEGYRFGKLEELVWGPRER